MFHSRLNQKLNYVNLHKVELIIVLNNYLYSFKSVSWSTLFESIQNNKC